MPIFMTYHKYAVKFEHINRKTMQRTIIASTLTEVTRASAKPCTGRQILRDKFKIPMYYKMKYKTFTHHFKSSLTLEVISVWKLSQSIGIRITYIMLQTTIQINKLIRKNNETIPTSILPIKNGLDHNKSRHKYIFKDHTYPQL